MRWSARSWRYVGSTNGVEKSGSSLIWESSRSTPDQARIVRCSSARRSADDHWAAEVHRVGGHRASSGHDRPEVLGITRHARTSAGRSRRRKPPSTTDSGGFGCGVVGRLRCCLEPGQTAAHSLPRSLAVPLPTRRHPPGCRALWGEYGQNTPVSARQPGRASPRVGEPVSATQTAV